MLNAITPEFEQEHTSALWSIIMKMNTDEEWRIRETLEGQLSCHCFKK